MTNPNVVAAAIVDARGLRADLSGRWQELCSRYLPLAADDSIWRLSRAAVPDDPEQGWKLHVSATVLTACTVLEKIAPLLQASGTRFKAPASLNEVHKINSGLYYGYSQVGKFITVYPKTSEDAVRIARQLYELTRHTPAPSVPFDLRFRPDGCIYYRYGAFTRREIENPDGTRTPAIRDPEGRLIPDLRDSTAKPDWVVNPFVGPAPDASIATVAPVAPVAPVAQGESPLKTTYRAFRALTQRGRGGVYEAVDLSAAPPRLCILKEGRREGELGWDGRDGSWRVRNEERVLASLGAAGIGAPRVHASFTVDGNYYLVTELIEGENLQKHLLKRRRRLALGRALRLGGELASLLARIHAAGWTWRDCKPSNIMLTKAGVLRPLDFEGACPVERPDRMPWGTPGFTPPEWHAEAASRVYEDLYALGATLHLLLTGELPETSAPAPITRARRNVPPEACRLISKLLTADPRRQPTAQRAARRLLAISHATRSLRL